MAGVGRLTPRGDSRLQGGGRKVARRACSQICSALRSLSNACRSRRSARWEWFEAEERQALADSLRAETLGCIHCAPKKQARRAQLIGMGASTPSRARRDRRGIGASCVQPNKFRAAFAVQHLPLWAECVVGFGSRRAVVRGGRAAGVGRLTPRGDSRLQGGGRQVARRACSQICSALRSLSNACRSGQNARQGFEAFGRSRPPSHSSITASFLGERRSGKGPMGGGGV